ncbi:MAG: glycosyltransferase family 4 protein [Motilibacteraceae bacterium]
MPEQIRPPAVPRLRGPGGRPLRVAHLTTVDLSLQVLLRTELQADVEAGFEVFGISAPGPAGDELRSWGVTPVAVPSLTRAWSPGDDARAARELVGVLRRLRLDVLHTHTPKGGVLGRVLGRIARVPVVVDTCHGLWATTEDGLRKRALVVGAEAAAAAFADAELFQSAEDQRRMARWLRVPSQVVGNGTDLRRFGPDPEARGKVRADLGIAEDELIVLGVGRRVAEKGIREYAAAAQELQGRAHFCWVGPADPDKPDALSELPGVRWLGMRTDMPAVYAAADVFVLPSYREGFSRSGMEASATGLPLVVTDVRGCRELGEPEHEVLRVPPHDAPAVKHAVARLLDDPALRSRLGRAARDRALAHYDQRTVAARSVATYATVARRKNLGWELGEETA